MIGISTVIMHDELGEMSVSLQPKYERYDINGKNGLYGVQALVEQLNFPLDILILCDEDCFISNKPIVEDLVREVAEDGYAFAAVPDGGVYMTRQSFPFMPNNFFVILNLKLIREKNLLNPTRYNIFDLFKYTPFSMIQTAVPFCIGYIEPYYQIYGQILANGGKPLWLFGEEYDRDDHITTEVSNKQGVPFALHTWFARDYDKPEQKERIKKAFKWAQEYAERIDHRPSASGNTE